MAEGSRKLTEEEICECLKSLNVAVRLNEVKVPTREFMIRVFECFLKDLEIDVTGPELRTWTATSHIEEGELYEEPMSLVLLAMAVNHITSPCGLNITIKDISEPKPKRTKKILNYIIFFWNYYLQKLARFQAIEATYEEDKRKAEDLVCENQALDEKINVMSTFLRNMQPNKEELSDVVSKIEQKTTKSKEESETIVSEYQGLKSREANIRSEMGHYDLLILKTKQTIEELDQLILSSPDKINIDIQKLNDKIKAEDAKLNEFENKLKDTKKKLELIEKYKVEEEKDLRSLNDLKEATSFIRETVKDMVSSHQNISEEEDKVKRLQMDLNRKEELVLQQDRKFATVCLSGKKQIEALKEVLKGNLNKEKKEKEDLEFYKASVKDMQNKIDSESDNVLSVLAKCKEAKDKTIERKAENKSKMKSICDAFKSECHEIQEKVEKMFPYSDLNLLK